ASPNPLVELPCTPEEAVAGSEVVIVSHPHSDHFDPLARRLLPKAVPLFCQPCDREEIEGEGFTDVRPVQDSARFQGVSLHRVPGRHGTGGDGNDLRLHPAGSIRRFAPRVVITHSSGAVWGGGELIVMDAAQTLEVCRAAPRSTVIAVHMEALDHGTVSRRELRARADEAGIPPDRLAIPADGEEIRI
ncbi:MAG: hypothetical protein A2V99_08875, partial [Spirochaetes bacterium RBG_16_67_19]